MLMSAVSRKWISQLTQEEQIHPFFTVLFSSHLQQLMRVIFFPWSTNSNAGLFWQHPTDTSSNDILMVIWASLRSVKLTYDTDHYSITSLINLSAPFFLSLTFGYSEGNLLLFSLSSFESPFIIFNIFFPFYSGQYLDSFFLSFPCCC